MVTKDTIFHLLWIDMLKIPHTRETLNLSMSGDSSTDSKMDRNWQKWTETDNNFKKKKKEKNYKRKFHVSCVTCHVSCVTCHMSHIPCHLSPFTILTPTATTTDPPPANSPAMHNRLVHKDLKILICFSNLKQLLIWSTTTKNVWG